MWATSRRGHPWLKPKLTLTQFCMSRRSLLPHDAKPDVMLWSARTCVVSIFCIWKCFAWKRRTVVFHAHWVLCNRNRSYANHYVIRRNEARLFITCQPNSCLCAKSTVPFPFLYMWVKSPVPCVHHVIWISLLTWRRHSIPKASNRLRQTNRIHYTSTCILY